MEVQSILHMNIGDGESSYACNSFLQETAMRRALPVLKHTIKGMANIRIIFSQCFKMADLGCSSSINSLLVASYILDMVHDLCQENNHKTPQFEVCLNDLFGNDFNTIIRMLPKFYSNLKREKGEHFGPCFVSATPGSFYTRIFPNQSLHLVHSLYAIHWLSQVPEGLENNTSNIYMSKSSPPNVIEAYQKHFYTDFRSFLQLRSEELVQGGCMVLTFIGRSIADPTGDDFCIIWELLAQSLQDMIKEVPEGVENNTSNIYMSKSSPPNVIEAYQKHFYTDFRSFLQLRSEELVQGGCMVLTFVGRSVADPTGDDCCIIWELLAQSLQDMIKEGLIQQSDFNSFNMPYYNPCEDEVKNIIQNEGSFSLDMLNAFQVNWDPQDTDYTSEKDFDEPSHIHGKNAAKVIRAVTEPLLTSHFGYSIIDILFDKFEKHVALHLTKKKTRYFNLVISLSRK